MTKAKLKAAADKPQAGAAEPTLESAPDAGLLRASPALPWQIAFALLALLAFLEVWFPVSRIGANYEFNYNEGWNAYLQQTVADGGRIFGQAPVYAYANYPPLSFHVVGWIAR